MSGIGDLSPGELRELLRQATLLAAPGELLVVMVPGFTPWQVRELSDALNAVCADPYILGPQPAQTDSDQCTCGHPYYATPGTGIRVLVVPGTAVTIAQVPADPFPDL
jgi:hypothetical protein